MAKKFDDKGGWFNGGTHSSVWWASLSDEEKEAARRARALRKQEKILQQKMEQVIQAQVTDWLTNLNNAASIQLQKAIEEGDTKAFIAVWDRLMALKKETNEEAEDDNAKMIEAIIKLAGNLPD